MSAIYLNADTSKWRARSYKCLKELRLEHTDGSSSSPPRTGARLNGDIFHQRYAFRPPRRAGALPTDVCLRAANGRSDRHKLERCGNAGQSHLETRRTWHSPIS